MITEAPSIKRMLEYAAPDLNAPAFPIAWADESKTIARRTIRLNPTRGISAYVNAHYFDLIRKAHPAVEFFYQYGPVPHLNPLVGLVGGEIVALLIPIRVAA